MPAHRIPSDWAIADFKIADPGASGTISHGDKGIGFVPIVTATAETRMLEAPQRAGLFLALYLQTDGGNCVITAADSGTLNSTGNNTITMATEGDFVLLYSVPLTATTFRWQEVANPDSILSTV